ncbi:cation transport protein-domain-containing protein [Mariannaea sp. PMI_226]|nr:cation transport protein-domain-containing protein [Mariannaea sp. PMI_226]
MFDSVKGHWNDLLKDHERLQSATGVVRHWLPPVNFITIHYAYFILLDLILSLILWGSNVPHNKIGFADCLFLITSGVTGTGLNTVDLSRLTTWQQVLVWLSFILGSSIWVSFFTILARKHAFEKRFKDIVQAERDSRRRRAELKQGQRPGLGRFMPFDKFKASSTSPRSAVMNSVTSLPHTGEKGKGTNITDNTELSAIFPLRQTVSAPEGPESDTDGNSSRTTTIAAVESEIAPIPSHVRFADSQSPRDRPSGAYSHPQGGNQGISDETRRPSTGASTKSDESEDFLMHWKKFLGSHNVTKRGQIYNLTSDEREALGGVEYRALKVLAVVVPLYGLLWQCLSGVALGAWIAVNKPGAAREYGANPWWAGIFLSGSAFNNAGMSVIDPGMSVFQSSYFVLIVVGALIVAGNTGYPILLRSILSLMLKILNLTKSSEYGPWRETIEFILKYPRRVYTTLFPSHATWWLLLVLLVINTTDWVAFEILNIKNPSINALPIGDRIFAGWFQAIAIRAAGFAVVSISSLYPAVQLLYMVMMYISVYPVTITMRHSNVYEERSLGIYDDDDHADTEQLAENGLGTSNESDPTSRRLRRRATAAATAAVSKGIKSPKSFVSGVGAAAKGPDQTSRVSFINQQVRGQLAHDMWWLVVPLLIIMIIETGHFLDQPLAFSLFNILFEVVSGYATVGLSVGFPNANYSFCGAWHTGSKIILCIVMIRGRHRGLPVALDKAVRLPGEHLAKEEQEDMKIRRTRTMDRLHDRED